MTISQLMLGSLVLMSKSKVLVTLLTSRYTDRGDEKNADKAFIFAKRLAAKIQPLTTAHYVYRAADLLAADCSKPSRAAAVRAMGYLQVAATRGDLAAGDQLSSVLGDPGFGWTIEELELIE